MREEGVWKYNPDGIGYVMERAPASHTLSERMRDYAKAIDMPGDHGITGTIDGFANAVAALEAELEAARSIVIKVERALTPVDKLKQGYERAGLSSALVVNNRYGKHSAFGYMGRE